MDPVIPIRRPEPFDDPAWIFELKYDGFRGIADTVRGRVFSKRGKHLRRFDALLSALPPGCVFDGEIVAPDRDGRPIFIDVMFNRRPAVFVTFDVLYADGSGRARLAAAEPQGDPGGPTSAGRPSGCK